MKQYFVLNKQNQKLAYLKGGHGTPLIMLHGNQENSSIFQEIAENLINQGFKVYLPDSIAHGASDQSKTLSYEQMTQDLKTLIDHEQIKNPIFFGFSDGGIIGLILASTYPMLLKKLIVAGVNLTPKGVNFKVRFLIRLINFFKRSKYLTLMLEGPWITKEDLSKIQVPTIIFRGSKDIVKKEDALMIVKYAHNAKLIELPNENHASYVISNEKLYQIIKPYLE